MKTELFITSMSYFLVIHELKLNKLLVKKNWNLMCVAYRWARNNSIPNSFIDYNNVFVYIWSSTCVDLQEQTN